MVELVRLIPSGGSYAVLFADYLAVYFPQISGWKHWLISSALNRPDQLGQHSRLQMVGQTATLSKFSSSSP